MPSSPEWKQFTGKTISVEHLQFSFMHSEFWDNLSYRGRPLKGKVKRKRKAWKERRFWEVHSSKIMQAQIPLWSKAKCPKALCHTVSIGSLIQEVFCHHLDMMYPHFPSICCYITILYLNILLYNYYTLTYSNFTIKCNQSEMPNYPH